MSTPTESNDPLAQSLLADATRLSRTAAAEARSRRRRRINRVRLGVPLLLFLVAAVWSGRSFFLHRAGPATPRARSVEVLNLAAPKGYVKVLPEGALDQDEGTSPETSEQEKQLLKDLGEAPLLIVRNDAGNVRSVHVFESAR
jgi:hypothetical protein